MTRALLVAPLSEAPAIDLQNTLVGTVVTGSTPSPAPGAFFTWTSAGITMGFDSADGPTTQGVTARYFTATDLDWSGADFCYVETEWPVDCLRPWLQVFISSDAGTPLLNFINTAGFASAYGPDVTKAQIRTVFAFRLSECVRTGTAVADYRSVTRAIKKLEFRLRVNTTVSSPQSMRVIRVWAGKMTRPKCVITYDNIFASVHTTAWGALTSTGWRAAGLKGVMFMSQTDLDDVGLSMTAAQVQDLYADGWDVGLQNSDDSNSVYVNRVPTNGLTASGTTATWVNQANIPHLLVPGNSVTITGATPSTYNGTFVVQTVPNAWTFTYTLPSIPSLSPALGSLICCARPGYSTREDVVRDVALSRARAVQNGWTRGNECFAYSNGMYSQETCEHMEAAGIRLTRTTASGPALQRAGFDLRLNSPLARHSLPNIAMDNRTAAQVLADIDAAIALGSSFVLTGHGVQTVGDSLNMATAEFLQLVAGVKARVNQGLMDVVTMSQLWRQMNFARA